MSDCIKTPMTVTPCEFPFSNEECPIGYISTNCVNFAGEDDALTGVTNGEYVTVTLEKIINFVKDRTVNSINSNTLSVSKISNNNGINFGLEIKISNDLNNQLTFGSDGQLFAIPYPGELLTDTNTVDIGRDGNNRIKADVRYVQSATINLSSTPSGLKADLTQALMNRIATLEQKVQQLENQ